MFAEREFVPLNHTQFAIKEFDCTKPSMNTFLARYAAKNMGLGLSSTWVLPAKDLVLGKKTPVAAYYTLAGSTVSKQDIPSSQKLPGYPVPVVMLARMAVDQQYQGNRLGEKVLVEALRQAAILSERGLPAVGLILDVLDEDALAFYKKFDLFKPFTDDPMRLFVPMSVVQQI